MQQLHSIPFNIPLLEEILKLNLNSYKNRDEEQVLQKEL